MSKFLVVFLCFFFGYTTAFAGPDTDRICNDNTKRGKIFESISVSYPGEIVSVRNAFKTLYSKNDIPVYDENARERLYYVVNIQSGSSEGKNKKSELYEYDCQSKTPRMLLTLQIFGSGESYYTIDYHNKGNLVIAQKFYGMADGGTERVVIYNIYDRKKLFDIPWNGREGTIEGFVSGKNSWYLYIPRTDFIEEGKIYRIHKNTKRVTQL